MWRDALVRPDGFAPGGNESLFGTRNRSLGLPAITRELENSGDYDDANTFMEMFTSNDGNNRTGWKNKEYDDLITEANEQTDKKAREKIFQKAETMLVSDNWRPIIPPMLPWAVMYSTRTRSRGFIPTWWTIIRWNTSERGGQQAVSDETSLKPRPLVVFTCFPIFSFFALPDLDSRVRVIVQRKLEICCSVAGSYCRRGQSFQ